MKNFIKSFFCIIILSSVSCQTDDAPQIYEQGTNEYTNDWIYRQMKRFYYWNGSLPGRGDLAMDPQDYFSSLLDQEDRFSYSVNLSNATTFPKSLRNPFGFDIEFIEHNGQVLGVVLYVLSDSPAYYNGLKRGQYISAINGVEFNQANYNNLYNSMVSLQSTQLKVMNYEESAGFSKAYTINITKGTVLLQPVKSRVLHEQNRTVGYIEIPHFDVGLAQSLLNAFLTFKSQSVDEVVVDLRYNGGGDVSSAAALAILLAPNIEAGQQFIRFTGNANGGIVNQSFREALETNETQVSFGALRNAHPDIQRVFILCGNHTASASEIIINNLRPFMEVVTIGSRTVGKDIATFPIQNEQANHEKEQWVLYPAIYKLSNANGDGNYAGGIAPAINANELEGLEVHALGAVNEVLLKRSLSVITGGSRLTNTPMAIPLPKTYSNDAEPIIINKIWINN